MAMMSEDAAASESTPESHGEADAAAGHEAPARELTPEEQMALYEESLKETDWGHQPC